MGGLLTPPAVGETYGGGTVTRRQVSPQGQVRLLVNGQWITFEPSPPLDGFKPGDTIRLANPKCWEAKLWKIGDRATVKLVWENGTRLVIETPRSRKDNFCYTVDAANWELVEPPAPPPPPPPPVIPEPVGFERLIGQQVEYEGRMYTLLDYLPACGFCQISGHGETKCVPENQVKGEIP